MKKHFLLICAALGSLTTAAVFSAGIFGNALPKVNYAASQSKAIVYSETSNPWPSTSPNTYNATTLLSGTLSGDSVVATNVTTMALTRIATDSYFYEGSNPSTSARSFLFYSGLTGIRSAKVTLAEIATGTAIDYNTYASSADVTANKTVAQGTLTSEETLDFTSTEGNLIGIVVVCPGSSTIKISSIELTWAC
jgi:hypothetical protein